MKRLKTLIEVFLLRNIYDIHWLHILTKGRLRTTILRFCGAKIGSNVQLGPFVYWDNHLEYLEIGNNVIVSPQVCFLFHKRDLANFKKGDLYLKTPHKLGHIILKDNCTIGTRAVILPGVTVGEGACVGAGAIVTKDVPAWSVAVGFPAKVVRTFNNEENER